MAIRGRRRLLAALAATLLSAGCSRTGDLGRPQPSHLSDDVLPAGGLAAAGVRGEPVSLHPFTDDEEELRDRAWRFLMPAWERLVFDRQMAELARTRVLPSLAPPDDAAGYFRGLKTAPVRSPASLFATLAGDAEADARLVGPFAETAGRVAASDRHRLAALFALRGIEPFQGREAVARVAENGCLVAWVRERLGARVLQYRYALDHLFVETPQGQAVGAERALRMLVAQRHVLDGIGRPEWACAGLVPPAMGEPSAAPPPVVKG